MSYILLISGDLIYQRTTTLKSDMLTFTGGDDDDEDEDEDEDEDDDDDGTSRSFKT